MKSFLVTGGAGFVGSSLALGIKRNRPGARVISLDNLKRRGSELNLGRLRRGGVEFIHGDVRNRSDLELAGNIDCVIDCAAEPSVMAGFEGPSNYVVESNLLGTVNSLELARRKGAAFIFLSSSRVYPYTLIDSLLYREDETRFDLEEGQSCPGVSWDGFSEELPLSGLRSLYGATKLASELLVQEYLHMYGLRGVINRCGVIAGPWQMGKVDQGVITYWLSRFLYGGSLTYIGYQGKGKQVRDILHVEDLLGLLEIQLPRLEEINGDIFNVGGGRRGSVSLVELTELCSQATGKRIQVGREEQTRPADIRLYLSDCRKLREITGWQPKKTAPEIIEETAAWMRDNRNMLEEVLG